MFVTAKNQKLELQNLFEFQLHAKLTQVLTD